ncbi:MAG: hypothetical protein FHK81_16950 [Marinobacter vinifirmus]|uniref:Uncharacterized protein n=1 Tax=Marinobacter vinifirmus TaxID=355591 RepID=A0A558B1I4_9GAMM|nr:MAG: hypothetical protein FHK81_16950 [Marinobacter vinifirmus]
MTHRDRSEYKTDSSVMAVCKSVTIPGMTGHVRRNTHQYAGRLHREADGKQEVTIYDYLDTGLPMLERMFRKREKGYKAMGYQFSAASGQTRLL